MTILIITMTATVDCGNETTEQEMLEYCKNPLPTLWNGSLQLNQKIPN